MYKKTFLKKLKQKLSSLDPFLVEEIIENYDAIIEDKKIKGMKETDIIKEFGDIDILVSREIKKHTKMEEDPIENFTNKLVSNMNDIIVMISRKSPRGLLKFFAEIFIFVFLISVAHIPVKIIVNLGKDVFNILSNPINRFFFLIWRFVLEFAYFLLALLSFVRFFKIRYLSKETNIKKESKSLKKDKLSFYSLKIIQFIVFFIKLFAIIVLFLISIYLIFLAITLVICCYLLLHNVTYFGFYIVMISLFFLGVLFFWVLFNFVLDRDSKIRKMLFTIIFNFVLLGVGCGIAGIEIKDTEYINSPPSDLQTDKLSVELTMNKDTVFIGNISDLKIDENTVNVNVDYIYYPLTTTMSTNVTKKDEYVYLNWDMKNIYLKSEFINHFVADLSQKKVYNYYIEPTIVITSNEKNIKRIKENRQKFYQSEKNYTSCEFVRTYYVVMEKEMKDKDKISLVLLDDTDESFKTVQVKRSIAKDIEEKNFYEFTFLTYQAYIDDDIEDLFFHNEIKSIKKTDKKLEEQRQDKACTIFY